MTETAPDISTVPPDLAVPALSEGEPSGGKRVRQRLPGWPSSEAYHVIYLPTDWAPGKTYPLLVEYMGNGGYTNAYGDRTEGWPEESKMGYGITGGTGFIWLCLPFLDGEGKAPVRNWWGSKPDLNAAPTVAYAKKAVPWICRQYGGDSSRVVLAGFSRGAIACNFIGLYDDEIARLWRAFIPYSHYDGVRSWDYTESTGPTVLARLRRLGPRPQFICHEVDEKEMYLDRAKSYLEQTGVAGDFTFQSTGFRNHNDAWLLRPGPARKNLRDWVQKVLAS